MCILKLQKVSEGRYVTTFGKFLMVIYRLELPKNGDLDVIGVRSNHQQILQDGVSHPPSCERNNAQLVSSFGQRFSKSVYLGDEFGLGIFWADGHEEALS